MPKGPMDTELPDAALTWGEALWTKKEQKWVGRLNEVEPFLYWVQKARKLVEIGTFEDLMEVLDHIGIRSPRIDEQELLKRFKQLWKMRTDMSWISELINGKDDGFGYMLMMNVLVRAGLLQVFKRMTKGNPKVRLSSEHMNTFCEEAAGYVPLLAWPGRLYSFDGKAWELINKKPVELSIPEAMPLFGTFPNRTVAIEIPETASTAASYAVATCTTINQEECFVIGAFPKTFEVSQKVEGSFSWASLVDGKETSVRSAALDGEIPKSDGESIQIEKITPMMLSAVAYLTARPKDFRPLPKKTNPKAKRAVKETGARFPSRHEYGVHLGQTIRLLEQKKAEVERENLTTITGRKRPVPHWRDPHHRVYWTGEGRTTPVVKWIDAVIVNADVGEPVMTKNKVSP